MYVEEFYLIAVINGSRVVLRKDDISEFDIELTNFHDEHLDAHDLSTLMVAREEEWTVTLKLKRGPTFFALGESWQ